MEIKRGGSQKSSIGPATCFTGAVRRDPLIQPAPPALTTASSVTFEPGARTAWHKHPIGQILIITAGFGWVRSWGGPRQEVRPGDVVWIGAGEKHWHGASDGTSMTHIAITESREGKNVEWLEHVSDEHFIHAQWREPAADAAT
jgi:quercetin dioxygenase-like cupin family protein